MANARESVYLEQQDVIILGAGSAGTMVAEGCARLGFKTLLVDKSADALKKGISQQCIQRAAWQQAAAKVYAISQAEQFGLNANCSPVDLGRVNDYVRQVLSQIQTVEDNNAFSKMGGAFFSGQPKFIDDRSIQLNHRRVSAKYFVIATGSRTYIPPIPGLEQTGFITSDTLLNKLHLPKKIIILGAGNTGLEFAQIFTRLGSQVIVIEKQDQILSGQDPELTSIIKSQLEKEGIQFLTGLDILQIEQHNQYKVLHCQDKHLDTFTIACHELMLATGKKSNCTNLNLTAASVDYFADGIFVDKRLRTSQKHIYALGDVIRSHFKHTHTSEYQANIVMSNIAFHIPARANYRKMPMVLHTDPEFAHIGYTEQQALHIYGNRIKVLRYSFSRNEKAIAMNAAMGLTKFIVKGKKIIGASIVGPEAGELITEVALGMQLGASLSEIASTIHPYPSLARVNKRTVSTLLNQFIVNPRIKRAVTWLNKVLI